MTRPRPAMKRGRAFDPFIGWLLALVAAAHVALAVLVPDTAEKFQLGDRAWDRAAKVVDMLAAHDFQSLLAALYYHSAPGDYVFFLPAYAIFGPAGVIAQNIALSLIGVWFLYRIGTTWFSPAVGRIAAVVYALLPAAIFHPQVFASEAICNPLLIAATWYAGNMLREDSPRPRDAVLFGVVSAVVAFTRYLYLLFPLMVAALLILRAGGRRKPFRAAALALMLSYSLTGAWWAVAALNDGRYTVGFNFQGLGSNLYLRAQRMENIEGFALDPAIRQSRSMSVGQFAEVALAHPEGLAHTVVSDAVNLLANPGAAMVYGRYLGMFDLEESGDKDVLRWRDIRDRQGILAMIAHLWAVSPAGVAINVAMAAMLGTLYLFGAAGACVVLRDGARPLAFRLLLAGIPAYVFTFTFASGSLRWDHRSPMEFVLCLFFAAGVCLVAARMWPKRKAALALSVR